MDRIRAVWTRIRAFMEQDPERFERHNPANGWGDYRTCLDWLRRLRDQCRETMQYSRDPWREFVRVSW